VNSKKYANRPGDCSKRCGEMWNGGVDSGRVVGARARLTESGLRSLRGNVERKNWRKTAILF
jgi:hypothetical protein